MLTRHQETRRILSPTSGFIREAGFTHSLTPARNCTYGCTYCYVPTMRIFGGLQREDWERWGQFTTFKTNAAALLARELRPGQVIYCSPLVDPYQPSEAEECAMPRILEAIILSPPRVFVLQTRGTLILRDLRLLQRVPGLRVGFSVTTDRDEVRRRYEPHCEPNGERLQVIRELVRSGIRTHVVLAPLLPCSPENLAQMALEASPNALIADPLHVRAVKAQGATTREGAFRIAEQHGDADWFDPDCQAAMLERIGKAAAAAGRPFGTGPEGFSLLTVP